MTPRGRMAYALIATLLAACGGGTGNDGELSAAYAFSSPALNSVRTYSQTITDNSNNTINLGYTETATAVNADGSYVVLQEDPNHESVIVNGTTYGVTTETVSVNNSGQETSYSYTDSAGSNVTCTFNPHGAGPNYPITVGGTWTLSYSVSCGNSAPVDYVQSGSVVDMESVTVPAGSFQALKLQSTLTWTVGGTTRTQTITNWRDSVTSISVKESISTAYSGTPLSGGYPIESAVELTSGP